MMADGTRHAGKHNQVPAKITRKRVPGNIPNRMSEDMPKSVPNRMPESMPDIVPDTERMSEDTPGSMPKRYQIECQKIYQKEKHKMPGRMSEGNGNTKIS